MRDRMLQSAASARRARLATGRAQQGRAGFDRAANLGPERAAAYIAAEFREGGVQAPRLQRR